MFIYWYFFDAPRCPCKGKEKTGRVGRTRQGGRLPSSAAESDTRRSHIATKQVDSTQEKAREGVSGERASKVAPCDEMLLWYLPGTCCPTANYVGGAIKITHKQKEAS